MPTIGDQPVDELGRPAVHQVADGFDPGDERGFEPVESWEIVQTSPAIVHRATQGAPGSIGLNCTNPPHSRNARMIRITQESSKRTGARSGRMKVVVRSRRPAGRMIRSPG